MPDPVADLHLGLKELAAEDRDTWVPLALSDRLRDVVGLHEAQEVELIRTLALWDRRTAWAEDGAVTAVSWLRHNLGMTAPEAAAWIRLGRHYDQHRPVADALDGGLISVAKVRVMLKAEKGREAEFAACVEGIVTIASQLSLPEFTSVMAEWADALDSREPRDDSKNSFRAGQARDRGHGFLDTSPDELAIVIAALEALDTLDPNDGPEPPRPRERRWHDLMIDIFRRALADQLGEDPTAIGGVDIITDPQTAAELTAEHQPSLDEQLAPYQDADIDTLQSRRLEHTDGTKVSRAFVAALICSGFVRRIILDRHTGRVLDVGRAQRRFTRRQWRALVARDRGCAFPGCDRKPKWCDAHHLRFWDEHEGPTDLDNGCLLCRRHHTLIHHRGWRLERNPKTGIFTATSPDGRQFHRRPGQRC